MTARSLTDEEYEKLFQSVLKCDNSDDVSEKEEAELVDNADDVCMNLDIDKNLEFDLDIEDLQIEKEYFDIDEAGSKTSECILPSLKTDIDSTILPRDKNSSTISKKRNFLKDNPLKNVMPKQKLNKKVRKSENGMDRKHKMMQRQLEKQGTWVQCCNSSCQKWRYLADVYDPIDLPTHWVCLMNEDEKYNDCSKEEQEYNEEEHILTKYTEGSVVWAKMDGYPWWPAMIEIDPDTESYFELPSPESMVPDWYHVVFFDDRVSRAWIRACNLHPFNASDEFECKQKFKKSKRKEFKKDFVKAKTNAQEALKLDVLERLKKYSFCKRFRGEWGTDYEENFFGESENELSKEDSPENSSRDATKVHSMLKDMEKVLDKMNEENSFLALPGMEKKKAKKRKKSDQDICSPSKKKDVLIQDLPKGIKRTKEKLGKSEESEVTHKPKKIKTAENSFSTILNQKTGKLKKEKKIHVPKFKLAKNLSKLENREKLVIDEVKKCESLIANITLGNKHDTDLMDVSSAIHRAIELVDNDLLQCEKVESSTKTEYMRDNIGTLNEEHSIENKESGMEKNKDNSQHKSKIDENEINKKEKKKVAKRKLKVESGENDNEQKEKKETNVQNDQETKIKESVKEKKKKVKNNVKIDSDQNLDERREKKKKKAKENSQHGNEQSPNEKKVKKKKTKTVQSEKGKDLTEVHHQLTVTNTDQTVPSCENRPKEMIEKTKFVTSMVKPATHCQSQHIDKDLDCSLKDFKKGEVQTLQLDFSEASGPLHVFGKSEDEKEATKVEAELSQKGSTIMIASEKQEIISSQASIGKKAKCKKTKAKPFESEGKMKNSHQANMNKMTKPAFPKEKIKKPKKTAFMTPVSNKINPDHPVKEEIKEKEPSSAEERQNVSSNHIGNDICGEQTVPGEYDITDHSTDMVSMDIANWQSKSETEQVVRSEPVDEVRTGPVALPVASAISSLTGNPFTSALHLNTLQDQEQTDYMFNDFIEE